MEQKINVAELLKDCPSGMELDCTMIENVYFDEALNNSIKCYDINNSTKIRSTVYFNKFGEYLGIENGKCVIFPKGKTTWEGFHRPFKDGDVLAEDSCIFIFQKWVDNGTAAKTYCALHNDGTFDDSTILYFDIDSTKLATEEEKQKLLQAIKANGYRWNPESKTLEKLTKPEFKVGDEIVKRNSISNSWIISSIGSEYYGLKLPNGGEDIGSLPISEQGDWELVHNKLEKLVEPIFKAGDRVMKKCGASVPVLITRVGKDYYYSHAESSIGVFPIAEQNDWVLVPNKFDINTLKPFESKVLVRDVDHHEWEGAIFGRYDGKKFFTIGGLDWGCCIPYENNKHLFGTTNDCDDYYKTWDLK